MTWFFLLSLDLFPIRSTYMYLYVFTYIFIYQPLLCFQFRWNRYTPLHLLTKSLVGSVEVIEKLSNLIEIIDRM